MKQFILKIALYLAITFVLAAALDVVFTEVYLNSMTRNKIQFIVNSPPKHYDVIFLGSSRAENHLVPEMFKKQGINAYNLGMSHAGLFENIMLLRLFFEKGNSTDKVVLQLDINFQDIEPVESIKAYSLPFLVYNNTIYNQYLAVDMPAAIAYKYVPFYRYCALDAKIGVREVVMSIFKKKSVFYKTNGFLPLIGTMNHFDNYQLPKYLRTKNIYYDQIVALCKIHHVPLIRFSAPFCAYTNNRDFFIKLKKAVPELYDYSSVIRQDSLFFSCGHMNEKGARIFTSFFLKQQFGKSAPNQSTATK